jgi:hypothetical protein
MSILLTMLGARQNAQAPAVVQFFSVPPDAAGLQLVVARRRLEGDELERALRGALAETDLVGVPPSVAAVVDDVSPAGEIRYYGLVVRLADGSLRGGRVSVANLAEPPARATFYSALGGRELARAAAEPSASVSGVYRIPTAPAAAPTPTPAYVAPVDPMEARRLAQQRAQQAALAASGGAPWGGLAADAPQ